MNSPARKTCEDGNNNQVFSKKIEFADFPLDTEDCGFKTIQSFCPASIEAAIGVSYLHKHGVSFDNREPGVDCIQAALDNLNPLGDIFDRCLRCFQIRRYRGHYTKVL